MLYIGLFVGGIVILFEYFGGTPAITTPTSSTPWPAAILNLLSSPWALLWSAVLGIFVLIAVSVWRKAETVAGGFLWNQEKNDLTPLGRLLVVIGFVAWFIFAVNYAYSEPRMEQFFFGISDRGRWVTSVILVALAHLPLSPLVNFIVPTKGTFTRAVIYAMFVVVIAYGGSHAHTTHDFFDPKTGSSVAYIDPTTNTPYHHDGWAPDTGEKLIPISKEVAKRLRNQSTVELAKQKADKWLQDTLTKPPSPPPAPKPKEPEKEEKKIRAGKSGRIVLKNEELKNPRAYQVRANYGPFANPDGVASFSEGEDFELLAFGTGGCSALIPLRGVFVAYSNGVPSPRQQKPGAGIARTCSNISIRARALTDLMVFGGGCPRPPGKPDNYGCLVFD